MTEKENTEGEQERGRERESDVDAAGAALEKH